MLVQLFFVVVFTAVSSWGSQMLRVDNPVSGSYIVKLHSQYNETGLETHIRNMSSIEGFHMTRQYSFLARNGFPAYSANLSDSALSEVLTHPDVAFIEQDGIASVLCDTAQQNPHNWGISRISAKESWTGSWYPSPSMPNPAYKYDSLSAGASVYAFVLDTGIECTNVDFVSAQCLPGKSFVPNEPDDGDYQGHGTHCSSILGGRVYGVAKKVFLQPVKVMNMYGSGTYADIMAGMDWSASKFPGSPGLLSMSIGGSTSEALNDAVSAVVASGRAVIAAAGNENQDACENSPASSPDAITVGSTDEKDVRADSSNYGKCMDIFAPGVLIQAAYRDGQSWLSGTSMACPHVAGVAAIALSLFPEMTPAELRSYLTKQATPDVIHDMPADTPNLLLYSPCEALESVPA